MIEILPLTGDHIPDAAGLFVRHYQGLRAQVAEMPSDMADARQVLPRLEWILANGGGLAAVEDGKLMGYLSWLVDTEFRGTSKTAAYCPEWGHAASPGGAEKTYRLLYDEASRRWAEAGYQVYALTYLVNNQALEPFLYHNGFGMIVMDAIRPIQFEAVQTDPGISVRRCGLEDAGLIAELDIDHNEHYKQPPTLMQPRQVESVQSVREFLGDERSSYWLAEAEGQPSGFMRFEYGNNNASRVVRSERVIAITGAFVRPQYRGRRAAPTILQAALADYAARGFLACSVDFESINPDAYYFWRRYFTTVCCSVMRCPEKYL